MPFNGATEPTVSDLRRKIFERASSTGLPSETGLLLFAVATTAAASGGADERYTRLFAAQSLRAAGLWADGQPNRVAWARAGGPTPHTGGPGGASRAAATARPLASPLSPSATNSAEAASRDDGRARQLPSQAYRHPSQAELRRLEVCRGAEEGS
jgi:hypothetical protein